MDILLEKNNAIIKYNLRHHLISLHFIQKINFQEYKSILNLALDFIEEKRVPNFLIDQRYAVEANIEERAWFISKWFPKLQEISDSNFKLGLTAPKNLFDKIGAEYVVTTLSQNSSFPVQLFGTMDEALKWIDGEL